MKETGTLGERLRQLYGPAPESCRQQVRKTCAQLEEEPKVKKFSGVLVAFALLLTVIGAAFAAHQLGVFDFLFPGEQVPEAVQLERQTGFSQQIGDFTSVDVTVLDAVSDGRSAFMVVQFKTKNPGDVLYSEFDDASYEPAPTIAGRRLVAWRDWEDMGPDLHLIGQDWQRPDEQTLLLHFVIDISQHDPAQPLALSFFSGVRLADADGQQKDFETAQVGVTLQPSTMEQTMKRAAVPLSYDPLQITFTEVEWTSTPLATYLRFSYQVDAADEEAWQRSDSYGNLWFRLQDSSGQEYPLLTGGQKFSDDGASPYQETVTQLYTHMDPSADEVVLIPYLSHTGETFPPVSLSLQ